MTLFKTPGAASIPSGPAPISKSFNSLAGFNKRERQCVQQLMTKLNGLRSHSPNDKLWTNVFQYITVSTDGNYTITVSLPPVPPSKGLVSEAATLFAMYCIRRKISDYAVNKDPNNGETFDIDETSSAIRPAILNTLLNILHSNGYIFSPARADKYYGLLNTDIAPIANASSSESRLTRFLKYAPGVNPQPVFTKLSDELALEINSLAKAFYTGYFGDATLFMSDAKLLASGDGTVTIGLMNLADNYGQIFFGYKYKGAGSSTSVESTTTTDVSSAGVGKTTTIHMAIDGLNYPSSGGDLGAGDISNTTVTVKVNGIPLLFRANRALPVLTPVDVASTALVNPAPATGISNYTFVDPKTTTVIATYNTSTNDLTFMDTVGGKIDISMTSGKYAADLDEVFIYLTVTDSGQANISGLMGLFNSDKFELSLDQKADLKTSFLNQPLSGTTLTIGAEVIKTIKNYSSESAISQNQKISTGALLSQGFIGKVASKSPVTIVSDERYYLTKNRDSREREKDDVINQNEAMYKRASMVGVTISAQTVNFNVISFEDESWSRLDNKVVGVEGEVSEPRTGITGQERLNKLTTLDNKTEYKKVLRPESSNQKTGLLAAYTDVETRKHPNPANIGGVDIEKASEQKTGFIPTYNPVLGGLRSIGVLEAIRDNLSKDSAYDYYVFSTLHELLFSTLVPGSPKVSGSTVSDFGLARSISYFDYQSLKWYSTLKTNQNLPAYHTGTNTFKILVPPGSGQSSPNNGAYPKVMNNTSADVYLCVVKNVSSTDAFINSTYYNDASTETITVTVSTPGNDAVIEFYTSMNNDVKNAHGNTGTVEFKLYSIPQSSGIPASYPTTGLHSDSKIIGVGGVAKFGVKKASAGIVTITVSQIGSGAITQKTQTLTFE